MGQANIIPVNPEQAQRLVDTAREVLNLFREYPELHQEFWSIFYKAAEIIQNGVQQIYMFCATYCIELTILLIAFALMVDNYKRVSVAVRYLRNSQEILSRLDTLYRNKIHPVLTWIDQQFAAGRPLEAVQVKNILLLRLQETREVLHEIEDVATNLHVETASQGRRNYLSLGGVAGGLAGIFFATTPPGQMIAAGAATVSFLGYIFGSDNERLLKAALRNLEQGKEYAVNIERELQSYISRLEIASRGF